MIHRMLRAGVAVSVIAALFTAVVGMRSAEVVVEPGGGSATPANLSSPDSSDDAARLLALAARSTPFRATGEVPAVRFGEAPLPPPPPPVPKPVLMLSGILWAKEPAAIIEGVPGREGQVVLRLGESEGVLRVTRIDTSTVTVTGLDTTWVLRVRRPW